MRSSCVYSIRFDGQFRIVEAGDFAAAVEAWNRQMKADHGDEWEGNEQPESVELISDEPVIR